MGARRQPAHERQVHHYGPAQNPARLSNAFARVHAHRRHRGQDPDGRLWCRLVHHLQRRERGEGQNAFARQETRKRVQRGCEVITETKISSVSTTTDKTSPGRLPGGFRRGARCWNTSAEMTRKGPCGRSADILPLALSAEVFTPRVFGLVEGFSLQSATVATGAINSLRHPGLIKDG